MTKELVIDCIRNPRDGQKVMQLIRTYCIDNGKDPNMTDTFCQLLYTMQHIGETLLADCRDYILDKYRIEYSLTYLYDKDKKLIMIY